MDSDSDKDEDEVKPSISATKSKKGSQISVVERMSLDSRKGSAEISNSSQRLEEISKQKKKSVVENPTSDSRPIASVRLATNEAPTLPRSKKKILSKSVIDDQVSSAETAKDLIPDVKDSESGDREETSQNLLNNLVQTPDNSKPGTKRENSAESLSNILATISAPKDSHIRNEPVNSQDNNRLLKGSSPKNTSNHLLPHQNTTICIQNSENTKSCEIQNEILEISRIWSNEAEMNAQSLVFQSSSVDPMENSPSIHLIGSTGLSDGVMLNESEQDSSSTRQQAGRKRKHSGKVQCHPVDLCLQEYYLFKPERVLIKDVRI